ncbi:MAG: OmpA family protein, partial [Thermoanaerobaculia bacterium]|nr:OmpA family protein [Thermoanaerobaculia bacterium]
EDGGLRTFKVGELTVLVEAGPRALLAVVVRGQPPSELLERMQETLETVHLQYRRPLADFDGDDEPFATVHPLLADRLETVVATDRAEGRGGAARWAWIAAALVVVGLVGWSMRDRVVFGRAVAALRAEPGITVLAAERGWGGWRFDGLRDPLARQPGAIVEAATGRAAGEVDGRWEPYMSFDPEILLARARRQLRPPEGVGIELDDGRLVASGSASARWALTALARARSLPGVDELYLGDLEIEVPEDLAAERRSIAGERVLFALGSARLDGAALATLDRIAGRIERLRDDAEAVGYDTVLRLIGRTDSSGTEQTNQALSEARARAVEGALLARGVEVDEIEIEAVGDSEPLSAAEVAEQARINRSVSFEIVFEGWSGT